MVSRPLALLPPPLPVWLAGCFRQWLLGASSVLRQPVPSLPPGPRHCGPASPCRDRVPRCSRSHVRPSLVRKILKKTGSSFHQVKTVQVVKSFHQNFPLVNVTRKPEYRVRFSQDFTTGEKSGGENRNTDLSLTALGEHLILTVLFLPGAHSDRTSGRVPSQRRQKPRQQRTILSM